MVIGKIGYLSKEKDEAYITVLSIEKFLEKEHFIPSHLTFEIWLDKLICIRKSHSDLTEFYEFDPEIHEEHLNLEDIQSKSSGISVSRNLKILDFIIDNEIDDRQNPKLVELKVIKNMIDYKPGFPSYYVNTKDISSLVEKYQITYCESGYDKPGDWSKASISIYTLRPQNLPNCKLDPYLQHLFPDFDFCLGSDSDCMEYRFKSDILRKLRGEIGQEKLNSIKALCEEMTNNIKQFAQLVYNQTEHASSLWHYYSKLKTEIKNDYRLKA